MHGHPGYKRHPWPLALAACATSVLLASWILARGEGVAAPACERPPVSAKRQWSIDAGSTESLAIHCHTVFIGGSPAEVGPSTGAFVLTDVAGRPTKRPPAVTGGSVLTIIPDGRRGWIIGGDFTRVGGHHCPRLARITVAGALDRRWCPHPDRNVLALARRGNVVFAGGLFTRLGGLRRAKLAAVALNGKVLPWNVRITGRAVYDRWELVPRNVQSLAYDDEVLYIGGFFERVNGVARSSLAAVDADDGEVLPWSVALSPDDFGPAVYALAATKERVYFSGRFDAANGVAREGAAAANRSGRVLAWNPDAGSGAITALSIQPQAVYAGGSFTRIGGRDRTALAALHPTTGRALAFRPDLQSHHGEARVDDLVATRSAVYAVGSFRRAARTDGAAFDAEAGTLREWAPHVGGAVALAIAGGEVAIGGGFAHTTGVRRGGLTAIDLDSGRILDWAPRFGGDDVTALLVAGDRLFVGGSFRTVNGRPRSGLAVFDLRSRRLETWRGPALEADSSVNALAVVGQKLLVAGRFAGAGGRARAGLAALDVRTGELLPWGASIGDPASISGYGDVLDFAVSRNSVFVAGDFSSIAGRRRLGVGEVSIESGTPTSWDARLDPARRASSVEAVEVGTHVTIAGWLFDSVAGKPRRWLASLDPKRADVVSPPIAIGAPVDVPYANTAVSALASSGRRLYIGGSFSRVARVPRQGLASVDPETLDVLPWQADPTRAPLVAEAIAISGRRLVSLSYGTVAVFDVPPVAGGG
jgi:hypothetical protein